MRIRRIDNTDDAVAARIVAIQRTAYAVEAELMSFDGIPPLHESVTDVQAHERMTWFGAFEGDEMVGFISWVDHGDSIEIDRLAVDPAWSRRGHGRQLVRTLPQAGSIDVSTGSANYPAVALYENEGFRLSGTTEVAPGVSTSQFRRVDTSGGGPNESAATAIASMVFDEPVSSCVRFTTGLRHWVYDVILESGRNVVLRLSHPDHRDELAGGVYWSKLLNEQGVVVPQVLAHNLSGPQPFMALERLPGTDLGNVFDELSESELRGIASSVSDMQRRTSQLPHGPGYGYALNYRSQLETSWFAVVEASIERSSQQIQTAGVVHSQWSQRVRDKLQQLESPLTEVEPVAFSHDATTKNVIISDGKVSGLVDVDEMAFGDPLWTVALTRMSLLSADRPLDYIDFLTSATRGPEHHQRLDLYTAVFCLGFLAELGQQFNKSAAPAIDPVHKVHLEQILQSLL